MIERERPIVAMTDALPAGLVERCAREVQVPTLSQKEVAIRILREAGVAEMASLLKEIRDNAWPGAAFGARIDAVLDSFEVRDLSSHQITLE